MPPGAEDGAPSAPGDSHPPWWERAFGREYLEIYAHRDDATAEAEVASLLPRLRAAPGPVLDACCGHGRHLAVLRQAGLATIGFDLSVQLLRVAAGRPGCRGLLARADARAPCFADGLGAVLLLFTAFGYFSDAANAECMRALASPLQVDGWMLLDLPDPQRLRETLAASSSRRLNNGHQVIERRRCEGDRVIKDISYQGEHWSESVRLYQASDIADMAAPAGLRLEETWPSLLGPGIDHGRQVHWLRRLPRAGLARDARG